MIIFLVAFICSSAVLFAGIPSAINRANRIHLENGRKPDAGIAFMPDLIVMVLIWWAVTAGIKSYFGLKMSLTIVLVLSTILFIQQLYLSRKSNREYDLFIKEHLAKSDCADSAICE